MAVIAMVTMKVKNCYFYLTVMKLRRNYPWY